MGGVYFTLGARGEYRGWEKYTMICPRAKIVYFLHPRYSCQLQRRQGRKGNVEKLGVLDVFAVKSRPKIANGK